MRTLTFVLAALAAVYSGCSTRTLIPGTDASVDASSDGAVRDASTTPDAGRPDSGPRPDGGPQLDNVLIYAHSRDTLYTFSPYTNTVAEVGLFTTTAGDAAPYMQDLAVDADGNVYTSSDTSLWRVDPATAVVTEIGDFGLAGSEQLNALTFLAPEESPDGTQILIGATNAGVYYRVDPTNAHTTMMGTYPDGWLSSGDIVSIEGLGTFATLKRSDFPSDVLARILFASDGSSAVTVIGPVRNASASQDFTQIFGLGYWGRSLYGFSNAGQLIKINRDTGAATTVSTSTGTEHFWGAGVTIKVPVLI